MTRKNLMKIYAAKLWAIDKGQKLFVLNLGLPFGLLVAARSVQIQTGFVESWVGRGGGGPETNPLLSLNYFISMGNFRKNWSNCTN